MSSLKMKKLQWKVKHTTNFGSEYDFLETLLKDNGVKEEDIKGFIHPTKKYVNDPFAMINMAEAVSMVHKHLKQKSKIFVKVDCDVDGNTSSAALIQFLQELEPEIKIDYMLNYEKQHGLTYKDMCNHTKDEYGLIIIPDASMTVQDAKMITANFSADILVLDHHLVTDEGGDNYTNYCLAVNCTDGQYPNPTLCGAGVVQKFIEAYMRTYETTEDIDPELEEKYLDLISLGLIADNMDLRNLESRYYAIEGMKDRHWNNEFINELVKRNSEDMKYGRYIISMGWIIAPKINGCIRYGKPDEQLDMFRAMLGIQEEREYQPRRKSKDDPLPPIEIHSLQKTMARVCENVKGRQDSEVRRFCTEIEKEIADKGLDKNSVLFVDGTKILDKGTVTGLIANRLASKYFRPVVLMRSKDATTFGGSMRGYDKSPIEDTKSFLESVGVTCMGHSNASGVNFPKSNLDEIIAKCNEKMPLENLCTVYPCDWEVSAKSLKREHVQEVAENYAVFGSTVPEPMFAITDLEINASQIQAYGDKGNFIRFVYNGIVFVKKYCQHDDFNLMTQKEEFSFGVNRKDVRLNIIGQFILSSWEDKVAPEVKILAFDSEDISSSGENKTLSPKALKRKQDDDELEALLGNVTSKKSKTEDDIFDW